jgi:hypothetical protein
LVPSPYPTTVDVTVTAVSTDYVPTVSVELETVRQDSKGS